MTACLSLKREARPAAPEASGLLKVLVLGLLLVPLVMGRPVSAEPRQAYYFDATGVPVQAWQTMQSYQGVINRDGPLLYLALYSEDLRWISHIDQEYGDLIQWTEIGDLDEYFTLPALFNRCNTMIVYDETDSQLAINGALTLAGIHGAAVVEEALLSMMQGYGFNIAVDARGTPEWSTNEGVQAWALAQRDLTTDTAYLCSEGDIEGRVISSDFAVRDNMLAFTLDSTGALVGGQAVIDQILDTYGPRTIATGWWAKEVPDVEAVSIRGHTTAMRAHNLSFFEHFTDLIDIRPQQRSAAPLPAYDPAKRYMFISYTQGDAMRFCHSRNLNHWTAETDDGSGDLVRERYPFGLMHSTVQVLWQPLVPDYLYATQSPPNQWFSAKPFGYANPRTLWENGFLADHLDFGAELMQEMGIIDAMINDRDILVDDSNETLLHILSIMDPKPRSVVLKHQLNRDFDEDDPVRFLNGVPVFGDPVFPPEVSASNNDIDVAGALDEIAASMQKRQFFWFFLDNDTQAYEVEDIFQAIEADPRFDDLVILNPDKLIELYLSEFSPGFHWTLADDATVDAARPDTNLGNETTLALAGGALPSQAYLKLRTFNYQGPYGALGLTVRAGAGPISRLELYRVADNGWTEETITWNNRPAAGDLVAVRTNLAADEVATFDLRGVIDGDGTYSFMLASDTTGAADLVGSRESLSPAALWAFNERTLRPVADARVHEDKPTQNFGDGPELRVRAPGSGMEIISHLRFEVTGHTGAPETQALELTLQDKELADVTLYRVNDTNWEELGLTWNNQPALGEAIETKSNLGAGQTVRFDLGDLIQGNGDYGFALTTTVDAATRDFNSRETTQPPRLILGGSIGGNAARKPWNLYR